MVLLKKSGYIKRSFSLAEWSGMAACLLAIVLFPLDPRIAAAPPVIFLLLCLVAPFLPAFSFFLPIISRGRRDDPVVALTFDDGPDPVSTPKILALLAEHAIPATFFITGKRAERYPELVRDIIARGHSIGNHSYSHDNFVMFKRTRTLVREIEQAQQVFDRLGITPLAFRPPVGVTSPRLAGALKQTGLYIVNFSRRAGDMGNRRIRRLAGRILGRLRSGDIIMLHDIPPGNADRLSYWIDQLEKIVAGIPRRGLIIKPLSEVIGRPVMDEGISEPVNTVTHNEE